ncbi:MAG: TetR family transcriptional regulator [Anaerovoracaceae bacterium]
MKQAERRQIKKNEIMEKSFERFCEGGLNDTGIRALAESCGMTSAMLYFYFDNLDQLIVESTEHCMTQVEEEFMAKAPHNLSEVKKFIDEIPYWTAKKHGKKYRFMYQVYTSPKYLESGKKFFERLSVRFTAYAEELTPVLGVPRETLQGMIYGFVRACVHFALFEDEDYLKLQTDLLWKVYTLAAKEGAEEK